MRDLMAGDWPSRGCFHGRHRGGLTIERREFDLERLPFRVHVNHGTHVAHFEAIRGYGLRQDDAIVFLDHLEGHSLPGYAVTSRGASFPWSMIQTVLIDHRRLS